MSALNSFTWIIANRGGRLQIIANLRILNARLRNWNFLRWFLVGCATFGIDWSIFVNLYPHTGSVVLANLISGSCATSFNYYAHHRWTFKSDQRHTQSGLRYGAAFFASYLINTIAVKVLIVMGFGPGVAKLLALAAQAPISYLILKFFVFKNVKAN